MLNFGVPLARRKNRRFKPFMEAGGIEPPQDSPGDCVALRDGLRELAIVGLVVALTILSPVVAWTVVYAGALWADWLALCWCAAQWQLTGATA